MMSGAGLREGACAHELRDSGRMGLPCYPRVATSALRRPPPGAKNTCLLRRRKAINELAKHKGWNTPVPRLRSPFPVSPSLLFPKSLGLLSGLYTFASSGSRRPLTSSLSTRGWSTPVPGPRSPFPPFLPVSFSPNLPVPCLRSPNLFTRLNESAKICFRSHDFCA